MAIDIAGGSAGRPAVSRFNLFGYGFRPFFLGAGAYAALATLLWIPIWHGHFVPPTQLPLPFWHGHELVFGFAVAGLAGFLLTAVPNWVNGGPVRGARLALLAALWLAGRVAAWLGDWVPPWILSAVDLAFLPALAATIGPGIFARSARRNGVVVVLIGVLTLANSAIHLDTLGVPWASARWGLDLALGVFAVFIAVIGGRIVPAFTIGGMRMAGEPFDIQPLGRWDQAAVGSVAFTVLLQALGAPALIVAAGAVAASALGTLRLLRWQGWRTLRVPLVWVLHLGYLWLVVSLALRAASLAGLPVPPSAALHALSAGAAGTMILAVMTRASLGHSGRPLVADRWTTIAYLLVTAGAVVRVAASFLDAGSQHGLIAAAGLTWAAGFVVFTVRYLPILALPRLDGRPG